MSKHADSRDHDERHGAAIATIAVVGILGVVVSVLAIFHPQDSGPPDAAADVALSRPQASAGQSGAPSAPESQRVLKAPELQPQVVGKVGKVGKVGMTAGRLVTDGSIHDLRGSPRALEPAEPCGL